MSISFGSAVGNLMNCMGSLGGLLKQVRAYQTALRLDLINTTNGVTAQLAVNATNADIQSAAGAAYISQLNSPGDSVGSLISSMAQQIVNRFVFLDNQRINQNLTQQNVVASLQEIIYQMNQQGATVQLCTIGSSINNNPGSTNVGNGVLNVSTKRPSDGRVQENIYAETLQVLCNNDSYIGGATAGNEGFIVTGQGNETDLFAFDWPLGSNSTNNLNAIDGNVDVGSGNLLTNSGWDTWTSNVPNNWTLVAGVAGTNIVQNTSQQYDGAACIQIAGDGTTNFNITQQFNSSTGTSGTLSPLTQYSWNVFAKRDAVVPGSGVLTIDFIDGSNNVINDAGGTPNTTTIALTGLTTSYVNYAVSFRTPLILPSTIKVRIRLTTLLTNGRSVFIDKGSLGIMSRQYVGGPSVAVHAGSIPFNQGDFGRIALTNNRGGVADGVSTFQTVWARSLPMIANNLLLPSSLTPSISDALILTN